MFYSLYFIESRAFLRRSYLLVHVYLPIQTNYLNLTLKSLIRGQPVSRYHAPGPLSSPGVFAPSVSSLSPEPLDHKPSSRPILAAIKPRPVFGASRKHGPPFGQRIKQGLWHGDGELVQEVQKGGISREGFMIWKAMVYFLR